MCKRAGTILIAFHAIVLFASPFKTFADELKQYAVYVKPAGSEQVCELVQRRSSSHVEKTAIPGRITSYGCEVPIPRADYERRFRFCFFAGINADRLTRTTSFECSVQQRDSNYVFTAQVSNPVDQDTQVMCYFSCLPK